MKLLQYLYSCLYMCKIMEGSATSCSYVVTISLKKNVLVYEYNLGE